MNSNNNRTGKLTDNLDEMIGMEESSSNYQDLISSLPSELEKPKELFDNVTSVFLETTYTQPLSGKKSVVTIFNKGIDGGESKKIRNIFMNWQSLFSALPDVVIATTASTVGTWVIPFVALYIWNTIGAKIKISLTQDHATTLAAIWQHYLVEGPLNKGKTRQYVNEYRRTHNLAEISETKYSQAIDDLILLECVKIEVNKIRPIEWARSQ